jgi:hypothetical protein
MYSMKNTALLIFTLQGKLRIIQHEVRLPKKYQHGLHLSQKNTA